MWPAGTIRKGRGGRNVTRARRNERNVDYGYEIGGTAGCPNKGMARATSPGDMRCNIVGASGAGRQILSIFGGKAEKLAA